MVLTIFRPEHLYVLVKLPSSNKYSFDSSTSTKISYFEDFALVCIDIVSFLKFNIYMLASINNKIISVITIFFLLNIIIILILCEH